MKISFIATVLNEEKTIEDFIKSILRQSRMPDEIIIVDGGSTDSTLSVISNFKFQIANKKIKFKFIVKKGNRAVGRNEAIRQAKGDIIVCSDAGCILDKDWVKSIAEPFRNPEIDVVAGYYKGKAKNSFEKCAIPYFLVMEDKIHLNNFLPATRSMAFKKSIWRKIGGFDEKYSDNEDYVFARKLKDIRAKIIFRKDAIVYWIPQGNIKEAFISFYRFAKGDAESRILRPKVIFLFMRYIVGFFLVVLYATSKLYLILNTLYVMLALYIFWSIIKNFKYVNNLIAIYYLPVLQLTSDIAVMTGTMISLFNRKKTS